jgi:hypothetical protein
MLQSMFIPVSQQPDIRGYRMAQLEQQQQLNCQNGVQNNNDDNECATSLDDRYVRHLSYWNNNCSPLQQMQRKRPYVGAFGPPSKLGEAKQAVLHENTICVDLTPPPNLAQLKVSALVRDALKSGEHPEVRIPLDWKTLTGMIKCETDATWTSLDLIHCVPTRMGISGIEDVDFALEIWVIAPDGTQKPLHPKTNSIWTGDRSLYTFPCNQTQCTNIPLAHDPEPFTHVASQFSKPPRQTLTKEEFAAWTEATRAVVGDNIVLTCDRPSHLQIYIPDKITRAVYAHGDLLHKQWVKDGHKNWNWMGRCPTSKRDATLVLCSSVKIMDILTTDARMEDEESKDGCADHIVDDVDAIQNRVQCIKNMKGTQMKPGYVLELRVRDCHKSLLAYTKTNPDAQMNLTLSVAMSVVARGHENRSLRTGRAMANMPYQLVQGACGGG